MTMIPTTAQKRGMAYAPMPFGVLSFLSSSYVIHYILIQRPKKRARMYHRLVLSMNIALLPLSVTYIWSTMAIPADTPHYVANIGTINTCTAQGFISLMFTLTVPTYYASLVLQAYMGIKNNFHEEKYRWIEKPVHVVAYCIPCAYAAFIAATENFNPNGSGCWYAKSPRGCETDSNIPCERGQDISYFIYFVGLSQVFIYFIFPPSVVLALYCWMKKIEKRLKNSASRQQQQQHSGMIILREFARKQAMQSIYRQISLYLFSFWLSWVFGLIHSVYSILTGDMAYNLLIFSNCVFACQGFIYMVVYFTLQEMGRKTNNPRVDFLPQHMISVGRRQSSISHRPGFNRELTVPDIRSNVKRKTESELNAQEDNQSPSGVADGNNKNIGESCNFNIFDGTPDKDSPWAQFIDPGSSSSDDDDDDDDGCIDEENAPDGWDDEQKNNHDQVKKIMSLSNKCHEEEVDDITDHFDIEDSRVGSDIIHTAAQ